MEFEFDRRRVTKEDIHELIFHEILEYHPQLLKDYNSGAEKTNFLFPRAVDQFKQQFAHLEENGGKNVPVVPIDRKCASFPGYLESKILALLRDEENEEDKLTQTDINEEDLLKVMDRTDLVDSVDQKHEYSFPLKGPSWEVVLPADQKPEY